MNLNLDADLNDSDVRRKENFEDIDIIHEEEYLEKLAPLTDTFYENDFSSSSLLKNQGPNITAEMLSRDFGKDYKAMIQKIL